MTQQNSSGYTVTTYAKMKVFYKGENVETSKLPRNTAFFLYNANDRKISRCAVILGADDNISERIGEECRKNVWHASHNIVIILKSDLEDSVEKYLMGSR